MNTRPDAAMMIPVEKIARFIATGDDSCLSAFASKDVVILENFAPFLFSGPNAVSRWAAEMKAHAKGLAGLGHTFGPAQDFSVEDGSAFFALPTHWRGHSGGRPFEEDGGWAFLLVRQLGEWKVKSYGWAVTRLEHE